MKDFSRERSRMVDLHLAKRGISATKVLDAFKRVPRESFVAAELAEFAYEDTPLPIEQGQTISQPYIVALTIQELNLRGTERVLEVGTGSGYAAAVLGCIAKEVYTIERVSSLADAAKERLERLGFSNVHVTCGDVILPRFYGHQKSHASAVGVFSDGTETKEVRRKFQGRSSSSLQGRRSLDPGGRKGSRSDGNSFA